MPKRGNLGEIIIMIARDIVDILDLVITAGRDAQVDQESINDLPLCLEGAAVNMKDIDSHQDHVHRTMMDIEDPQVNLETAPDHARTCHR